MRPPQIDFISSKPGEFDALWASLAASARESGLGVAIHGPSDDVEARGLPIDPAGTLSTAAASAMILRARWVESREPDLVIATDLGVMPTLRLVGGHARVICGLDRSWESAAPHGQGLGERLRRRLNHLTLAGSVRRADRWIALNAASRRSWEVLGIPASRILLLDSGWGIPATLLEEARLRPFAARDREVLEVGVVGSAEDREALALALASRGTAALLRSVEPVGDASACFLAVNGLDILVSFATEESQALLAQIAGSTGVPVVAPRTPANEAVIRHRETGVLFAAGDLEAAARGVAALASREVRQTVGDLARSLALRIFDRDLALEKVARLVEAVLNGEEPTTASLSADGKVVTGVSLL